jgi:hypothetical protein
MWLLVCDVGGEPFAFRERRGNLRRRLGERTWYTALKSVTITISFAPSNVSKSRLI